MYVEFWSSPFQWQPAPKQHIGDKFFRGDFMPCFDSAKAALLEDFSRGWACANVGLQLDRHQEPDFIRRSFTSKPLTENMPAFFAQLTTPDMTNGIDHTNPIPEPKFGQCGTRQ